MIVYAVMYAPGEPDGVYTLCLCATCDRAEQEIRHLSDPDIGRFDLDRLHIEEKEVLE